MDFFRSTFFSELESQDVSAVPEEEAPFTSEISETLISSAKQESTSSEVENLHGTRSGALGFGAQGLLSSDATSLPGAGSGSTLSHTKVLDEKGAGLWIFGSLVKSIASKSEDIIQAYRKDLEEFGSELRKETQMLAEVASHAVKDLPSSLETGAYIAQESIESVGQALEDFSSSVWRGTADLISQGKEAVLHIDNDVFSTPTGIPKSSVSRYDNAPIPISSGGKYSRFEAQVSAMQHDRSTYCDEPSDASDYSTWKSTFSPVDKREDIENLLAENMLMQELVQRCVPDVVSEDTFWTRYFYRLHKLHQTEEARADLVKRASALEEEDLSWDIEEELEESVHDEKNQGDSTDESKKAPDNLRAVKQFLGPGADSFVSKASLLKLSPQASISGNIVNKTASKPIAEEDDLGWEVPEDVEESSSNDGKRS